MSRLHTSERQTGTRCIRNYNGRNPIACSLQRFPFDIVEYGQLENRMGGAFVIAAILLLGGGWVFSFSHGSTETMQTWRRRLFFISLLSLTAALLELQVGSMLLAGADFNQRFELIPWLSLVGLVLTGCALLTCWFGNRRGVMFVLPATLLVGFLWVMAVVAL